MTFSKFARTSGLTALATSLAITAVPAAAQDGPARNRYEEITGERTVDAAPRAQREARQAARQDDRQAQAQARDWQNQQARQEQQRQIQNQQARQEQQRQWQNQQVQQRQWQNQQNQQRQWQLQQAREEQARREQQILQQRNRTYANRDAGWSNGQGWSNSQSGYGSGYSGYGGYGDAREDYRQWDRQWRNDRRYDWQRYRSTNRVVFNLGSYSAPYRNYSYRRVGIGSILQQLLFSSNYQIRDPYRYRLPEVYGPYRWVRYYDDVLLVDIYSGRVVDVIHNFFW